jgi:Xaa-Pro aminopeptidase
MLLKKITNLMQANNIDAAVVSISYQFGYAAPRGFVPLQNLTGFSGSNGACILLAKGKSALFSDGRYRLQMSKEVDADLFDCYVTIDKDVPTFLLESLPDGASIAIDPWSYSWNMLDRLNAVCGSKNFTQLPEKFSPIAELLYGESAKPNGMIVPHLIQYVGESVQHKLDKLVIDADALLITGADSVCWLLNIRGEDCEHSPLLVSQAVLYKDKHIVLISDNPQAKSFSYQPEVNVSVIDRNALFEHLAALSGKTIQLDKNRTALWFRHALASHNITVVDKRDPVTLAQSIKNEVEIQGSINAHVKDGVAVCECLYWLEESLARGDVITEMSFGVKLRETRSKQQLFWGESFPPIVGFKENGAIIHYHATPASNKVINDDGLLLIDSGAQYLDGTTDITRTIPIGEVSHDAKLSFTRVLKAHIALASAYFPRKTSVGALDSIARHVMWQHHCDYEHGTGHGVGSFLKVHEEPYSISTRYADIPVAENIVVSNEPGYYVSGQYGIRIESLLRIIPSQTDSNFLCFDVLSLVPICSRMIIRSMLEAQHVKWLDAYHLKMRDALMPLIQNDGLRKWLHEATKPIV